MSRLRIAATTAAAVFIGCILAANYVTTEYGMVPVPFGLSATAGTYLAGMTFILRDTVQEGFGRLGAVALIVAGGLLSFLVSAPELAVASGAAFLLSELADLSVYTPLKNRDRVWTARILSNTVGTLVDTAVFLWLAAGFLARVNPQFSVANAWPGQVVGKLTVTAVFVGVPALVVYATRKVATA